MTFGAVHGLYMIIKTILVLLLGVIFSSAGLADSLKGGYAACLTKEAFDNITTAIVKNDHRGTKYYLDAGLCVIPKAGLPISILDTSFFTGTAKVRVYLGKKSFDLWTVMENIVRGEK